AAPVSTPEPRRGVCYHPPRRWGMSDEVLVLRLSSLGDVVLASAFSREVAAALARARVTFVVREDLCEVAAALPGVSRVVAVPRHAGIAALASLAAEIARTNWSHVFDLHSSLRSRLLTLGVRRRMRAGFHKQALPRWILLRLHRDVYARFGGVQSMRDRMLAPLVRMGFAPRRRDTQLVLPAAARRRAAEALARARLAPTDVCLAIAPGARWAP